MCCEYLLAGGAPAAALLKESASYDTVGNAWFTLTQHALPAGWRQPLVVTSAFHMPRSRAIFEWVFALPAADGSAPLKPRFLSTPDEGLDGGVVAARAAREAASLETLKGNAARVRSMAAFHAWINDTHACYAVSRQGEWGAAPPGMKDAALASY